MIDTILWILAGLSLLAAIININKNIWCWYIWFVVDIGLTITNFIMGIYSQAALFFVYALLAVYGWWQWRKQ